MSALETSARLRAFLRTFLIQGSWNNRTLLGSGFAFALLPLLRARYRGNPEALERAVIRHLRLFNAHPYLAGVAVSAVASAEARGTDEVVIGHFKDAIQGSLGSLGDRLVWASLRPLTLLLGLTAGWLGAPPYLAVAIFLVVYSVGHIALRMWGFRIGLAGLEQVGERFLGADLNALSDKVRSGASLALGALLGVLVVRGTELGPGLWPWLLASAVGFAVGSRVGYSAWRPTALTVASAVLVLSILGLT